jgi:hypothetical protein
MEWSFDSLHYIGQIVPKKKDIGLKEFYYGLVNQKPWVYVQERPGSYDMRRFELRKDLTDLVRTLYADEGARNRFKAYNKDNPINDSLKEELKNKLPERPKDLALYLKSSLCL